MRRYGGTIVWVDSKADVPTSAEYEATAANIRAETRATTVHPYDDVRTIAGQGTCALEFLEECPDLEYLLAPVGGGGLLAGTAVAAKAVKPRLRVVGCEPAIADDAQRSFRSGRIESQRTSRTIADGLRTSLGELTFPLISRFVDDIVVVTEAEIISAMRLAWDVLKLVIEPSSAVALAAILERRVDVENRVIGVVLSGGNVDLEAIPWLVPP